MPFTLTNVIVSLELAIAIAGAVLLWRLVLSPAARAGLVPPALARWNATIPDFLIFTVVVMVGGFFGAAVTSLAAKQLVVRGDAMTVLAGAGAQLGMLAGAWLYWSRPERGPPTSPTNGASILVSGTTTFLISLPLLLIAAKLWEWVLKAAGLPTERQSLIAMFANADSPWLIALMIILAVLVAPLTEELIFRAGLFRYLRSYAPRWVALGASSMLFASLHVNWVTLEGLSSFIPLMLLAVMFSLSYERTGKIGTPVVAHALFNLNTVLLIFSGVGV
jgi:membrane protease YdiL (CAAX protease family)